MNYTRKYTNKQTTMIQHDKLKEAQVSWDSEVFMRSYGVSSDSTPESKELLRQNQASNARLSVGATSSPDVLTTYKKIVDIPVSYGLTANDLLNVEYKINQQKFFLKNTFVENSVGHTFSLEHCTVSANHNPHRYHAEIHQRINTLEKEANNAGLTPVFITLTLPSEFHSMKQSFGKLVSNPKYNGVLPNESVKILTKMWAKLRHDRSLKELSKSERMYYRVNEPHKDGTPHAHFLLFIPSSRIDRVENAFTRFFGSKSNKFEKNIRSATAYLMKYINKTLPKSKEQRSDSDDYLNAWYVKNSIFRFCSSRSTAPIYLYRLLYKHFSLFALTQVKKRGQLTILTHINKAKVIEIWDGEDLLFARDEQLSLISTRHRAA